MKRLGFIAVLGLLLLGGAARSAQVGLIKINGAIGPSTASYIARALDISAARHDECLIIQLDTPGGLLASTEQIKMEFYDSKVPTVVFVGPSGAAATSAGTFITMAANIAAMAPNTRIGAAHPVGSSGEGSTNEIMWTKAENDAASSIRNIAEKRGRNADWAESAVRQSVSVTSEKALQLKVINLIATNLPDLLAKLDGRKVDDQTLHTAHADVVEIPRNSWERFSDMFLRPEILFVLTLLVIYGFIGELSSPGAILPGVVGAIALILVLYMSATLPVNVAGLVFIGLALLLFIADTFAVTHGVLTTGGIIAFFLGSLMLFNHGGPGYQLSLRWIISGTLITAAFFVFIVGQGVRAQFQPAKTGKETMIGKTVPAQSRIDSAGGRVFIEGEIWNAVSDAPVESGQTVEVTAINGLTLKVKPKTNT
jgi:membrane-bound serine protease (ClpP class)